jgi:hypothetical protein
MLLLVHLLGVVEEVVEEVVLVGVEVVQVLLAVVVGC